MTKKEITTYDCTDEVKKIFPKMKTLKDKIERIDLNEFFDTEIERKKAMFLLRKIEEQDKQAVKELKNEMHSVEKWGSNHGNRKGLIPIKVVKEIIDKHIGVWEDED